jgi:hypothetical protein
MRCVCDCDRAYWKSVLMVQFDVGVHFMPWDRSVVTLCWLVRPGLTVARLPPVSEPTCRGSQPVELRLLEVSRPPEGPKVLVLPGATVTALPPVL